MAYKFHLDKMLCPVAPSKLELKIKNKNKTLVLINGEEINILKQAGLTEISFDLLLPNVRYPFAVYDDGFKTADFFLSKLEQLKVEKKPFMFYVERTLPNGKLLFPTNTKVSLEDYTIKEDTKQGFDVVVAVKLKQYKDYSTKLVKVIENNTATIETQRETSNSPEPVKSTTYTVKSGDSLWAIAKAFYGDGSKYPAIYEANKDIVANASSIFPGQVLTIPGASETAVVGAGSPSDSTSQSGSSTSSTRKVTLTIGYMGSIADYGKTRVYYTSNGVSKVDDVSIEKHANFKVEVDKGTLVKIESTVTQERGLVSYIYNKGSGNARRVTWNESGDIQTTRTMQTHLTINFAVTVSWSKFYSGGSAK